MNFRQFSVNWLIFCLFLYYISASLLMHKVTSLILGIEKLFMELSTYLHTFSPGFLILT